MEHKVQKKIMDTGLSRTTFHKTKQEGGFTPHMRSDDISPESKARRTNPCGGFTLIETFVAITVLLVAIVGPMTIASRGLAAASFAKQQVTASFLAQEAVEYIHNVRTTNTLESESFVNGLSECIGSACYIDVWDTVDPITTCSGTCPFIEFSSEVGQYRYDEGGSEWEDTVYTRTIELTEIVLGEEYAIEVSVNWSGGLVKSKTVTVRDHILNWQ